MTTTPLDTAASATSLGPGAQLAQARADLHLAHEDVAAKLHLATSQIQALEQDDYSSLPGATYVRGYLKSYALLLGLSPEPILQLHARLTAAPITPDYKTIAPQKEITSRHHQVRFVTYIMAAIVVGLAFTWWQGRDARPPNPLLAVQDSQPVADVSIPGPDSVAGTEKSPAEAAASTTLPNPAVTENKLPDRLMPSAPVVASSAVVAPPPTVVLPVPATQSAGPRIKLVLHTDQESWADIRDAHQTRLLYETVPAGRSVTIEGEAPLSVFLGNAAGVRLDYNGQAVDIARHKRGMMARFTLGDELMDGRGRARREQAVDDEVTPVPAR